jgi:hypothetical protein
MLRLNLAIDEDQAKDSERNHTTEQVAYFIIDESTSTIVATGPESIGVHSTVHLSTVGVKSMTPLDILQPRDPQRDQTHMIVLDAALSNSFQWNFALSGRRQRDLASVVGTGEMDEYRNGSRLETVDKAFAEIFLLNGSIWPTEATHGSS